MGFLARKPASGRARPASGRASTGAGYDEVLAERVRAMLGPRARITERKMFGGLAFLVDGNMACGINKGDFLVRVGTEGYADALAQPGARPMDFTGRPLRGFVYVSGVGIETDKALRKWIERGRKFAASLPAK